MTEEPKKYEIGFLVREEYDEKEIKDLLKGYKAEILDERRVKKIKLAYPIKKEVSAHFGYIHFSLLPEDVKDLSKQLKLNQKVLRTIIVNLPKKINEPFGERKIEKPIIKERIKPAEVFKKPKSVEAINTELLEKKLEEILK